MKLETKIPDAGRMFKIYASRLEQLGIKTLHDLLYHMPSRYENYALISTIDKLQQGETVTIQGEVKEIKNNYIARSKSLQKAVISDPTGTVQVSWFNQPYLIKAVYAGSRIAIAGTVEGFAGKLQIKSPEYEILKDLDPTIHTGRLVPIYPVTRGISSKWLRKQVYLLLFKEELFPDDFLPEDLRQKYNLTSLTNALRSIHFPADLTETLTARERLAFDELFMLQLNTRERKTEWGRQVLRKPFMVKKHLNAAQAFINSLPYSLTEAQNRSIQDIFTDFTTSRPMNRLLQGDVGSGKTIVATSAMYMTYLNGSQSILMAPTEILAKQHFQTISNLLTPFKVKVDLATSSQKSIQQRDYMLRDTNILIGTHALLSEKIQLKKLGLVVIDEQQRFGVSQRASIREKGDNPHFLTMTATPIPRTVALTLYGDLDLSYLDEMPKNRKKIKTWLVPPEKRESAYAWIEKEIREHHSQAFIICPFIDESETMQTVKAASKEYALLQKEVFPKLKLGLLHGRQKVKEKDEILKSFRDKAFDILVATPIVEVGIDIPNATIIIIEAAERFGLSQLHQLRGRVGRGGEQSYCLLFTEAKNPSVLQRLKAMETMSIGSELAELDLKLRGAGEMFGTLQHGRDTLKIATFSDTILIQKAQIAAGEIYPSLSQYPKLQEKLASLQQEKISPD